MINELSQGISGSDRTGEYVELLVYRNPSETPTCDCTKPDGTMTSGLDLRGWIIDDNNGYFGTAAGSGLTDGAIRFADNPQWACVEYGTLILVYDDEYDFTGRNLPPDDLTDADDDGVYVLPANSTLFEGEQSDYRAAGGADWGEAPTWNFAGIDINLLNNTGDSYMTIPPNNPDGTPNDTDYDPFHSISWGSNAAIPSDTNPFTVVYTLGSVMNGEVHYISGLPTTFFVPAGMVPDDETPGAVNPGQNQLLIETITANFAPPTISNTEVVNDCDDDGDGMSDGIGTITLEMDGGEPNYNWSCTNCSSVGINSGIGGAMFTINSVSAGTYNITVTDNRGCEVVSEPITVLPQFTGGIVSVNDVQNCGDNNGSITAEPIGSSYEYAWIHDTGETGATANSLSPGLYTVTITDTGTQCQVVESAPVSTLLPDNACIDAVSYTHLTLPTKRIV